MRARLEVTPINQAITTINNNAHFAACLATVLLKGFWIFTSWAKFAGIARRVKRGDHPDKMRLVRIPLGVDTPLRAFSERALINHSWNALERNQASLRLAAEEVLHVQ